jgi:hypothetical protein
MNVLCKTKNWVEIMDIKKKNTVVLVHTQTIPTEQPQPAGEVSANFSW